MQCTFFLFNVIAVVLVKIKANSEKSKFNCLPALNKKYKNCIYSYQINEYCIKFEKLQFDVAKTEYLCKKKQHK